MAHDNMLDGAVMLMLCDEGRSTLLSWSFHWRRCLMTASVALCGLLLAAKDCLTECRTQPRQG